MTTADSANNITAPATVVATTSVAPTGPPVSSSSSVPIVVITPQAVRPYSGNTSWSSFKDHFERVAKVNKWETNEIKAQHLQLSLEGAAAECLRELRDDSPQLYQEIWDLLKRRFGEVDEARSAMTKFENRKQHDGESVVEFEQALRALYRVAWPKATEEQKNVALKARFEEGLHNFDMQQYLRLHASTDDFAATVQKARRFASTTELPSRPRKSVRISTPPPSQDQIQLLQTDSSLHNKIDKLEDMIRSMQVPSSKTEQSHKDSSVKGVNLGAKPQKPPPPKQSKGERSPSNDRNNNRSPSWPRQQQNARKQYARPVESRPNNQNGFRQWTPTRPNFANNGRSTPQDQRPYPSQGYGNRQFGPPRNAGPHFNDKPGCYVCGNRGCHSSNHRSRPQTDWHNNAWQNDSRSRTPPPRPHWNSTGWRNDNGPQTPPATQNWNGKPPQPFANAQMGRGNCWVCGNIGCRARFHDNNDGQRVSNAPPLMSQNAMGNDNGTRQTGNRGPSQQPARPNSQ